MGEERTPPRRHHRAAPRAHGRRAVSEHRPRFRDDVPEEERESLRELVRAFRGATFDANDVCARQANMTGKPPDATGIVAALTDLEEKGEIRRVPGSGEPGTNKPPEWEFTE